MPTLTWSDSAPGKMVCDVRINGQNITFKFDVRWAEIKQSKGNHELAIISIAGGSTVTPWAEGLPVQIVWGIAPQNMNSFFGYINHYERPDHNTIELWCLGSSAPMNNEVATHWGTVSPSYIATRLARKYSLKSYVDSYAGTKAWGQTGISDFRFLKQVADDIGYSLYVGGGVLQFRNPLLALHVPSPNVPMFTTPDTARDFKTIVGQNSASGGTLANYQKTGIDPTTGALVIASQQMRQFESFEDNVGSVARVTKIDTSTPAVSLDEARKQLLALQAKNAKWVTASVNLNGNALVSPMTVINIQGKDIPYQQEGNWLVDEVTHHIGISQQHSGTLYTTMWQYTMDVNMSRDQLFGANVLVAPEISNGGPVTVVLQNGQWVTYG